MQIIKLDHVNLRTTQLNTMIHWYTSILGLRNGERPDFPFPDAWLYAGATAVVHLVAVDEPALGSEANLKLEHFALSATDRAAFEIKLQAAKLHYKRSDLPSVNLIQINIRDPDGNGYTLRVTVSIRSAGHVTSVSIYQTQG